MGSGGEMIQVFVKGIAMDHRDNPVVLLQEVDGEKVLPIWIGPVEAAAIIYAIQKVPYHRPLTLDLIKLIIEGLNGKLSRTVITKIEGNTYYANLILEKNGEMTSIDARPSDSIAIALYTNAPIYVSEEIMNFYGRTFEGWKESKIEEIKKRLKEIEPRDFKDFKL